MTSHHAVLFCADSPLTVLVDEHFTVPPGNQYRQVQFGIDDVRRLISTAYRRPEGDSETQTLLVATEFVTEEAQQALLKIIEEPPLSTRFVFVVPEGYIFLATLESRFERAGSLGADIDDAAFQDFKNLTYTERLAKIEESVKKKDQAWHALIKKSLIAHLKTSATQYPKEVLVELEYVVRLLLTRGASNKFLLEHLALTLPA